MACRGMNCYGVHDRSGVLPRIATQEDALKLAISVPLWLVVHSLPEGLRGGALCDA
jgi:hypothetical protein